MKKYRIQYSHNAYPCQDMLPRCLLKICHSHKSSVLLESCRHQLDDRSKSTRVKAPLGVVELSDSISDPLAWAWNPHSIR